MVCVYCGGKTSVTNSRLHKKLNRVWRRRQCATCLNVFTTHESSDERRSFMVREDHSGKLLPFSRDKVFISLYHSCGHRKGAFEDAAALSDTVMAQLFNPSRDQHATVTKLEIKQTVLQALTHFDRAAATHYEAYHQL